MRNHAQHSPTKSKLKTAVTLVLGMTLGAVVVEGASAAGLEAVPSWQPIYVDGQQVSMTAYNIGGNNYVKLRDIGERVGFNVYWENGVQVDTDAPYTGLSPAESVSETPLADVDAIRQEMIRQINAVRLENGAAELPADNALMAAAQDCANQKFRHHDQQYEWTSLAAHGWPHGGGINLTWFSGAGRKNVAQTAVSNWANSPGHLQTMLSTDATCLGVGAFIDRDIAYCYMIVGEPSAYGPL